MKDLRRSALVRLFVLPFAMTIALSACYKWSTIGGPHDDAIRYGRPDRVRVTTVDGSRIEMRSPWIRSDSIVGLAANRDTLRLSVSDVARLEKRKWDWVTFAGGYVALSLVSWLILCQGDQQWTCQQ